MIERVSERGYEEERVYIRVVPSQHVHDRVLSELRTSDRNTEWELGESDAMDTWFDYLNNGNHAPILFGDGEYPMPQINTNRMSPGTVIDGPCMVAVLRYEL